MPPRQRGWRSVGSPKKSNEARAAAAQWRGPSGSAGCVVAAAALSAAAAAALCLALWPGGQEPVDRVSELVDAVAPPGSRFDAEQGAEISRSLQLRALLTEIVDTTPSARFASLEPPIIYIDDFLSAAECSSIIAAGTPGLRASAGAGKVQSDGKFQKLNGDFRSSSNAWCMGSCASDATVRSVEARIANLTGFPVANMEFLQILRRSTRHSCSRLLPRYIC